MVLVEPEVAELLAKDVNTLMLRWLRLDQVVGGMQQERHEWEERRHREVRVDEEEEEEEEIRAVERSQSSKRKSI